MSDDLFQEGKRLHIIGDYSKSLECLSKACKMMAEDKGDLSEDLVEPLLYYGKSALMYSQGTKELVEGAVGGAVEAEEEDSSEDSGDEVPQEGVSTVIVDKDTEAAAEKENIGYLQMAYEAIENAKLILRKQLADVSCDHRRIELRLADLCDVAGSIYVEEDNIPASLDEYNAALDIRKRHLKEFDRSISECYFNIGIAQSVDYRYRDAAESFEKCRQILISVMEAPECDPQEADEIKEIVAELNKKITEVLEEERDYQRAKEAISGTLTCLMPKSSLDNRTDVPHVDDITHLMRKRSLQDSDETTRKKSKNNSE